MARGAIVSESETIKALDQSLGILTHFRNKSDELLLDPRHSVDCRVIRHSVKSHG